MNPSLSWLAAACQQNRLTEKWLLAPDLRIAQLWKDQLHLSGQTTIHLHAHSLRTIVNQLVADLLVERGLTIVSGVMRRMLTQQLLSRLCAAGRLEHFAKLPSIEGLARLVTRSIQDLRLAGQTPHALSPTGWESEAKGRELGILFDAYCEGLTANRLVDYADCVQLAIDSLSQGSLQLPQQLCVLIPEPLAPSALEQRLLDQLHSGATVCNNPLLHSPSSHAIAECIGEGARQGSAKFEYFCATAEVNEVRGILQRVLAGAGNGRARFDQIEILVTDYAAYAPLFLELMTGWLAAQLPETHSESSPATGVEALPLTFDEGIACVFSRPGRALRGWLRWVQCDAVQSKLVQLVREGLLVRPPQAIEFGNARLADNLRSIPIGFQLERYLPQLDQAIESARQRCVEAQRMRADDDVDDIDTARRDFGLAALQALHSVIEPVVANAPHETDDAQTVLSKAKHFLLHCARVENTVDRAARAQMLEAIDGLITTLETTDALELDVRQWLEDLPIESHILASGPQPGRMHLSSLRRGARAGRQALFVAGLDDARFPRRAVIDPILLDSERGGLSSALITTQARAADEQRLLHNALYRGLTANTKTVTMSYSTKSLADDRSVYPSPVLLELFRITANQPTASLDDLHEHLGPPVAFVNLEPGQQLDMGEVRLASLLCEAEVARREAIVDEAFPHQRDQRHARQQRCAPTFNEFSGHVPEAGLALSPVVEKQRVSPSRLESYGACPRRFFFRYGLNVFPPDECTVDPERWLDPLQFGTLVHGLFEAFLRLLTSQDLVPEYQRDRATLLGMLDAHLEDLKSTVPIPNVDALRRQTQQLREVCEVFLRHEEEYCRTFQARPWIVEASIGLGDSPTSSLDCPDPIELTLSDGRRLYVGGRIDRVDRFHSQGSERYIIWDYKSGSDFGFSQDDPFRQGRKLQPYLYVGMLRHRIAALGGDADAVDCFGYFFPTPSTDGLRLRWTRGDLRGGDEILRHICDAIEQGVFIATSDEADCTYCDYRSVCGDPQTIAEETQAKASEASNEAVLGAWTKLRSLDPQSPDVSKGAVP